MPRRFSKPSALAVAAALCVVAGSARACELDGLSHGYGPMSALFAGAHQYQSLNGMDKQPAGVIEPPPPPKAAPPTPRRSFVAWAKARPKSASAATEAPATWARATMPSEASTAAPAAAVMPIAVGTGAPPPDR